LGGNRKGKLYQYRNLVITMLLGGLWHGANWKFVIWGGVHGTILALEKNWLNTKNKYSVKKNISTFLVVTFIWIFFRAETFQDSLIILKRILTADLFQLPFISSTLHLAICFFSVLILAIHDIVIYKSQKRLEEFGASVNHFIFSIAIVSFLILISLFASGSNNFIYFQF
jgi:alginate O-acetyltransferase complex protein AlgI